jgi:hypothetical protein
MCDKPSYRRLEAGERSVLSILAHGYWASFLILG